MQSGEYFVTRVCDLQGRQNRLRIAQLADHDDIRILTKRLNSAILERENIATDFSVTDDAPVRLVDILDRGKR